MRWEWDEKVRTNKKVDSYSYCHSVDTLAVLFRWLMTLLLKVQIQHMQRMCQSTNSVGSHAIKWCASPTIYAIMRCILQQNFSVKNIKDSKCNIIDNVSRITQCIGSLLLAALLHISSLSISLCRANTIETKFIPKFLDDARARVTDLTWLCVKRDLFCHTRGQILK